MAGENAALWQVQASAGDGTEATATTTHTVLFNTSTKVPSDGAFIGDIRVSFRRAVPENEGVDVDNNEIQDMGIDGIDMLINGMIGDADNDVSTNSVNKLSKWLQDGNTTTLFTKGRYGLRLDNAPQWNVVPSSTYGYHIREIAFDYIGEAKDLVQISIKLALGGDIASAI
jgi:hypothetical protein